MLFRLVHNRELIPTGTFYTVSLLNKNGSGISGFPQTWCTYGGASGTINVSQGAPTGNCGQSGVFYPTPLFASPLNGALSQSIGGSLNVAGSETVGGNLSVTGNLVVSGNETFTGSTSAQNLNGILNAALFPGGDIGAKINAAVTSLSGAGGEIYVPAGSYSFSTSMLVPRNVRIHGAAAYSTLLTYTGSSWAVIVADSGNISGYMEGSFEDLSIIGLEL